MVKALLAACALTALTAAAHADDANASLVMSPTRIIFEPGQRSQEASVTNVSNKRLRYKVEFLDQIMNASGTTVIAEQGPYSAKPMLRFMPQVIDLEGGKRQTIRIMANRPAGLADGDYHTHMLFTEIVARPPSSTTPVETKANRVTMEVGMSYSMAVPVVVQQGKLEVAIEPTAAQTVQKDGKPKGVMLNLKRSGNAEGVVHVRVTLADGTEVTAPRNVRMYREANAIETLIPFTEEAKNKALTNLHVKVYQGTNAKGALIKELTIN